MSDIEAIHRLTCPNFTEKSLQLSCDGVQENKSSANSIDVYSVCMKHCKNIYPHKLVRPLAKFKVDHTKHLTDVINDILLNSFRILQFIGDNPKRAIVKKCKNHSSWYACEYCYAKGIKIEIFSNNEAKKKLTNQLLLIEEQIRELEGLPTNTENRTKIETLLSLKQELQKSVNALKTKSNILWPHSTMNSVNRTRSTILEIVQKLANNEILSIDEAKGVNGRSVLLDIPMFNFVYDSPAEYLHCSCLGVIKRLIELTFDVGERRTRVTRRKLSLIADFNKLMLCTKVFKEFSRRARSLDFSVFKAQEYRNIGLFFFIHVLSCIDIGEKERILWLNLAFMLRSSVIPSAEYSKINIDDVTLSCEIFYQVFEEIFGPKNCPYNLHVFCSHLTEIRTHGPLTETSAFKFESFYGEMRKSFVPGTTSTLKQIMKNILLKRTLTKHVCENNIFISNYETSLECNNLVYTYERNEFKMYQISEVDGNTVSCYKIGQYPVHFEETPHIDWSTVGVFKKGGTSSDLNVLQTSQICGKVLKVDKYLMTCPTNVLNEK